MANTLKPFDGITMRAVWTPGAGLDPWVSIYIGKEMPIISCAPGSIRGVTSSQLRKLADDLDQAWADHDALMAAMWVTITGSAK